MSDEPNRGLSGRLGWRLGWTIAGALPYVAVTVVQLASKFTRDLRVDRASKALEMPTLAFGVGVAMLLAHRRPAPAVTTLLFAGIGLSWLGDVFLDHLTIGLGLFFAAHAAYIAMFELAFRHRRPRRWAVLAVPWYLALLIVLTPRLGPMTPAVVLYGLILGAMAVSATRGNGLTAAGGVLFLVSDTLLSIRLFTPLLSNAAGKFAVMLSYLIAQALIAVGMLRTGRPTEAPATA